MSSTLRTRADLRSLMERQMTAATTVLRSPSGDEDLEGRTALKVYLLEAHGRMRTEPFAALGEIAARAGLDVQPTHESELIALTQGEDFSAWLDVSRGHRCRLYTTASAREADRVHELLVAASPMLAPAWIAPRQLEALATDVGGRMVLFSLRHDRRPLRREESDAPDAVDLVTLRFWAPAAQETLAKMRRSDVLPGATSVASVRVRLGEPDAYALAEGYFHGKFTSVGSSFAALERMLERVDAGAASLAKAYEHHDGAARRVMVRLQTRWTQDDLLFAVSRIFSGAEPFGLWGIAERVEGEGVFRVRALDVSVAKIAEFELSAQSAAVTLPLGTPASVAVKFLSALRYHVHAAAGEDETSEGTLFAHSEKAHGGELSAFEERSSMDRVASAVLTECVACWLRGHDSVNAASVVLGTHGAQKSTPALADLARRVLAEAAAHEWREWLRPVRDAEQGTTSWKWTVPLPLDHGARGRELQKLHRAATQLVARVSGGVDGPWSQLSLFDAESLVPPSEGG